MNYKEYEKYFRRCIDAGYNIKYIARSSVKRWPEDEIKMRTAISVMAQKDIGKPVTKELINHIFNLTLEILPLY